MKAHATEPSEDKEWIVTYGYQIWRYESLKTGVKTLEFQGNGGQVVGHDINAGITMVTTAGHYSQRGLKKNAWTIYDDFIQPAILKEEAKVVK